MHITLGQNQITKLITLLIYPYTNHNKLKYKVDNVVINNK